MAVVASEHPSTLRTSFSFYVPSSKPTLIAASAELADAVTVRGPKGPSEARATLGSDWGGALLFDRAAYEQRSRRVDSEAWLEAQAAAGADRLLTPGSWVAWNADSSDGLALALETEWKAGLAAPGSTLVLAIDSRWLGRAGRTVIDTLRDVDQPVALVLAHRGDPLSGSGVLDGLLALVRSVGSLTILRSDHGAIGAIAFGATHGSIGLQPSYRHFVPQGSNARHKPNDPTPRVFVRDLMDWFTAATIAGWGASSVSLICRLSCCEGARIDRFLDPQWELQADVHNRTTLAFLADYVLGEDPDTRRRLFARLCSEAVDHYGPMGKMSNLIEPKSQLVHWAQWA